MERLNQDIYKARPCRSGPTYQTRGAPLGADEYVTKPFSAGRLAGDKHERRFDDNDERAPLLGRVSFAVVALPLFVPLRACAKSSFRRRLGLCWELYRTRLIRMREGS